MNVRVTTFILLVIRPASRRSVGGGGAKVVNFEKVVNFSKLQNVVNSLYCCTTCLLDYTSNSLQGAIFV